MSDLKTMRDALKVLRKELTVRAGYTIELDEVTDNILISSGKLAFCVTSLYIKDHPNKGYLDAVRKNLEHLRQLTDDPEIVPKLFTPREMALQRGSTRFDPNA